MMNCSIVCKDTSCGKSKLFHLNKKYLFLVEQEDWDTISENESRWGHLQRIEIWNDVEAERLLSFHNHNYNHYNHHNHNNQEDNQGNQETKTQNLVFNQNCHQHNSWSFSACNNAV